MPGILDGVYARRFNIDRFEPGRSQTLYIVHFFESASDAADPQLHALSHFGRHFAPHYHIGNRETTARLQHTESFSQHAILVAREVNDAIRDDDIDRAIRQWDVLDLAVEELDVGETALAFVLFCERLHFIRHIEAVGLSGWADALCREQDVDAAP